METDWLKCFICQKNTKEGLRCTEDGLNTLAKNIEKFEENDALDISIGRLIVDGIQLYDNLMKNNAKYHHTCRLRYSNSRFDRIEKRKRKPESITPPAAEIVLKKLTRKSDENLQNLSLMVCCFCVKSDTPDNLIAAGTLGASNSKAKGQHVNILTNEWKNMAAVLNHTYLLNSLSSGDVTSNKLNYHKQCYTNFRNKYRDAQNANKSKDTNNDWLKEIALNKILCHIRETAIFQPTTVFKVKQLEDMYSDQLEYHNVPFTRHTTRFADLLVKRIPQLTKTISDKQLCLFFKTAVTSSEPDEPTPESFFQSVQKIISSIRNVMADQCSKDNTNFVNSIDLSKEAQIRSVPIQLLTLINLLIDGVDITSKGFSKESLNISQCIMYNFRQNTKSSKGGQYRRHDRSKETPFPLYASVKIYNACRSKTLINCFHDVGICLSYSRLLDITKDISNRMIAQYERDKVFLPRTLMKGIFTVMPKDNLDQNSSSSTGVKHTHVTAISVLQFPTLQHPGTPQEVVESSVVTSTKKVEQLPPSYTCINNFLTAKKILCAESELKTSHNCNTEIYENASKEEKEWLLSSTSDSTSPWSQYHARKKRSCVRQTDINAILPLINDVVHTLDMQYHCMDIIKRTVAILNPGQIPIDVCDEPIFALTKEIQWRYPETFGNSKYFCLFGSLHIEKSMLIVHGQLIKGTGMDKVLTSCGLSIAGTRAIVNVNHIKQARYCLQVVICVIFQFLHDAHLESGNSTDISSWLEKRSKESQMCFFWKLILEVQINILIFIRSIREGNFPLYISSLRNFVKWYFSLDHYNYARWISVHLFDLLSLEKTSPCVYQKFHDVFFAFQKTNSEFSLMGLDQVHEQNNTVIKGMGGATHSLNSEDESGLARWELCAHELSLLIEDFEDDDNINDSGTTKRHHEDTEAFQVRFSNDVAKLRAAIVDNPFQLNELTVLNDSGIKFNGQVFEDIKVLSRRGEDQFQTFWNDRLINKNVSIKATVTLNSFNLPGNQTKEAAKDPVMTSAMFTKLRDAAILRRELVQEAFQTEFFGICQSLAKDQFNLYHGTKSLIPKCLDSCMKPCVQSASKSGIVIELSPLLRSKLLPSVKTFNDFALSIYNQIADFASHFDRWDIVADQYFEGSLKEALRINRGTGTVKRFDGNTTLPSNFVDDFLSNSINKTNLNLFLAKKLIVLHGDDHEKIICVTYNNTILTNKESVLSESSISNCVSEEADARLIRHAINLSERGYTHVRIRTIDSDVLVLAIAHAHLLIQNGVSDFLLYLTAGNEKYYNLIDLYNELGDDICKALPFFHAFTGCDTTSSFYRYGKVTFWNAWMGSKNSGDLTRVFKDFSNEPSAVSDDDFSIISEFVLHVYYPQKKDGDTLNYKRMDYFMKTPHVNLRQISPSTSGLLQHVKRSCIQAGWLWKLCVTNVVVPNPEHWGWKTREDLFVPLWQEDNVFDVGRILKVCTCRKGSCTTCMCKVGKMKCLTFCKCEKKMCKNS